MGVPKQCYTQVIEAVAVTAGGGCNNMPIDGSLWALTVLDGWSWLTSWIHYVIDESLDSLCCVFIYNV